jgi:hypothetical protein
MKVLLSESIQTIIFIEIRKELPPRGRVQVTDSQAESKEVKHYRDLNALTIWSVDELAKHDAAAERQAALAVETAPVVETPAPKEKTPTLPTIPAPETKPEPAPELPKPVSDPAPAAKFTHEDTKKKR